MNFEKQQPSIVQTVSILIDQEGDISMSQYFAQETFTTIFELNSMPTLAYICKTNQMATPLPRTLHIHHDLAEIIFIRQGQGTYTINNHSYKIKKGDLLFINSGILHNEDNGQNSISTYCMGVKKLRLKSLTENQLLPNTMCPVLQSGMLFSRIHQFFSILAYFVEHGLEPGAAEIGNCTMRSLLVLFRSLIDNNKVMLAGEDYNLGLRIKEYIDEHYLEDINLSTISTAIRVNTYYLSHVFKKIVGYSPMQYVIHRRIGEAQNLLINTDYSITQIALMSGYNNSNYFQVVFNTMVGMPPGKYRKSWINNSSK